jgi:anthranilate phosphoribosyltransferase
MCSASFTAALVVSAAGVPVAKHGNRAASSKSWAADVLEDGGRDKHHHFSGTEPQTAANPWALFLFCPKLPYILEIRGTGTERTRDIRTIFNILGPLVNPAGANMELLGGL